MLGILAVIVWAGGWLWVFLFPVCAVAFLVLVVAAGWLQDAAVRAGYGGALETVSRKIVR